MGQVWAARLKGTRGFQKFVAIKTLLPSNEDPDGLEGMLFAEASLASHVHHPNVVGMLDLGEQDGLLYLVMEWVDGEPLDYVMRTASKSGGIPLPIAVNLVTQALRGLQAAHEACDENGRPLGIVHRDISPQNLLVTYQGTVKLVDFGVAKATHQMSQPTVTGQVKGKFAYMSPEQVRAHPVDARTDVFAMGIVLYLLTAGRHPFKGDTPADTLLNILSDEPILRPAGLVRGYPPGLEAVVMRALAKNRDDRFSSAHDMMIALEKALPPALKAGVEKDVAGFVQRLFADRMAERSQALKHAMDSAVPAPKPRKSRGAAPHIPRSTSTMRAVTVPTDDGGPPQAEPLPTRVPPRESTPPSSRTESIRRALRGGRVRLASQLLAVALGLSAAAAVIGVERLRARVPSIAGVPAKPHVTVAAGVPSGNPLRASVEAPPVPTTSVSPPVSANPMPQETAAEAAAPRPLPAPVRRLPRHAAAPAAAPTESPAQPAAATPVARPAEPAKDPEWDPLRARR
jgi:eukaryotic-like serine/threonine-protein kinase